MFPKDKQNYTLSGDYWSVNKYGKYYFIKIENKGNLEADNMYIF